MTFGQTTRVERRRPLGYPVVAAVALVGVGAAVAMTATMAASDGSPMAGPAVEYPLVVARLLARASGVAAVGVTVLVLLVGVPARAARRPVVQRALRVGVAAGLLWSVASVLALWLEAAELSPAGPAVTGESVLGYVLGFRVGAAVVFALAGALGYLLLTMLGLAAPESAGVEASLPVALAAVVAEPISSHTVVGGHVTLATLAVGLHVLGAAVWIGGLGALLLLLLPTEPELLAGVLPRYSRLASGGLFTVASCGVLAGARELAESAAAPGEPGFLGQLIGTPYGGLLLAKAAVLLALGPIGGLMRWHVLPAVRRGRPRAFLLVASVELVLMVSGLALATVLSRTGPG